VSAPAVIGLDLSIAATGVAYPCDCGTVVETWDLPAKLGDSRLEVIASGLADLCPAKGAEDSPDLVVIEDLPTHARSAGITGMVHGAVRVELIARGIPYALVPPATLKKFATGRGNADKTAMALAAFKRAGVEFADDNQCDAWWLRQAGLTALGSPEVDLPQAQVDALAKVDWPEVSS